MEKTERGRIPGLPKFMRCSQSQERLKLWTSQAHSEQKAVKNFGDKGAWAYSQGLSKIFRAAIYSAHRAVVFAIAQLSCFLCTSYKQADCLECLSRVIQDDTNFMRRWWSYTDCIRRTIMELGAWDSFLSRPCNLALPQIHFVLIKAFWQLPYH